MLAQFAGQEEASSEYAQLASSLAALSERVDRLEAEKESLKAENAALKEEVKTLASVKTRVIEDAVPVGAELILFVAFHESSAFVGQSHVVSAQYVPTSASALVDN